MTIPLDVQARRRLIVVKQLAAQALAFAEIRHATVPRVMAVISYDLSVETVLGIASDALGAQRQERTFDALVQSCNARLRSTGLDPLPRETEIRHVHDVRNDAQHKGKHPSEATVAECGASTRAFLEEVVRLIWGEQLADVRLAELVRDDSLGSLLLDAESKFEAGDLNASAVLAAGALAKAEARVRTAFVGAVPTVHRADGIEFGDRELVASLKTMQETVLMLALGLSLPMRVELRQIMGVPITSPYINGATFTNMKSALTIDEARFVLSYSTDAVLQIEETVGDLDNPFAGALR